MSPRHALRWARRARAVHHGGGGQHSEPEPLPSLWAAVLGTERLPPGPAAPAPAASVCTRPQGLVGIQPRPRGPGWALGSHVPIRLPGRATGPLFADVHEDTRDQGEGPRGARHLPVLLTMSALPLVLEPARGEAALPPTGLLSAGPAAEQKRQMPPWAFLPALRGQRQQRRQGDTTPSSARHTPARAHTHTCAHTCACPHTHMHAHARSHPHPGASLQQLRPQHEVCARPREPGKSRCGSADRQEAATPRSPALRGQVLWHLQRKGTEATRRHSWEGGGRGPTRGRLTGRDRDLRTQAGVTPPKPHDPGAFGDNVPPLGWVAWLLPRSWPPRLLTSPAAPHGFSGLRRVARCPSDSPAARDLHLPSYFSILTKAV